MRNEAEQSVERLVKPLFGVIANVVDDSILRRNAKVWILFCNGDAENPQVKGLSIHGRSIIKFIPYKRLTNFRSAYIPIHLRDNIIWSFNEKEKAQEFAKSLCEMWSNIRFYSRDGKTLLKDGNPSSEAFKVTARVYEEPWY